MKAQIVNQVKKQLTIVIMILSIMAGSYAQKSVSALKEFYNLKQLKSLVEVLNNTEMNDAILGSTGSESNKIISAPEQTASDAFMVSEEEELMVEDWILDEAHFRLHVNEDESYEAAGEEKPVIEEWMLDESHFLSNNNLNEKEITSEDELKVENWMTDLNHWVLRAD